MADKTGGSTIGEPLIDLVILTCGAIFGAVWIAVSAYTLYPLVRVTLARVGGRFESRAIPVPDGGGPTDAATLPSIDLLVPAYDESRVIADTIRHVLNADYPPERLSVTVLVEPDDDATRETLDRLKGRYDFAEVVVPAGYPGDPNKPRALNYGFEVTAGDIVGVVDAEDTVDPRLFRTVAAAVVDDGYDVVQGRLDMTNDGDGWLNTMFRGEYGLWYRLFLSSCDAVGYPIPLGGSTNFVRRTVLERISERRRELYGPRFDDDARVWLAVNGLEGALPWDPANVTEDFELGLFLWREGFDVGFLDVETREESPLTLGGWLAQRTRWQKGKMYTFLELVRTPPPSRRAQVHTLGQAAIPHLGLVNSLGVVVVLGLAWATGFRPPAWLSALLWLSATAAVTQMGLQGVGYWLASRDVPRRARLIRTAVNLLTVVPYWLLQWAADLRAIGQIYAGRLHWEKTDHNGQHRTLADGGTADHELW